jgi:4-diphosphocytidyl-2-C-methyl-D-erythritol kinase
MITFPNAKINIGLNIVGKRPDGFHDLETIFFPVGWTDVLEIAEASEVGFASSGIELDSNPDDNLVVKAYRLLQKDFGLPALKIHLHKQIPFGAGLGGGSSDAAFMLRMLDKTYDLQLSQEKLLAYAAVLGSDCPFFILNRPVLATGRGDIMNIIDLKLNKLFLLLVKPPIEVATANAFRFVTPKTPRESLADLIRLPVSQWRGKIVNQFEESVFQQFPDIEKLRDTFYRLGAVYASMSGSGSSVFGFFNQLPEHPELLFPAPFLTFSQQIKIH